ncbi:MAG: hypothetical protein JW760_10380 [Spirochaetales bacterium]|nr:hypothetical protein [Spirochaetales bacterium]
MEQRAAVTKLLDLMAEEILLLEEFGSREEMVRSCVRQNNWSELNLTIQQLSPLAEKIEAVERLRDEAFTALKTGYGESEDASFYHVVFHLPDRERDISVELYRKLKMAALRIQSITLCIDSYVRTVSGTVRQILEEIFPYQKGKIYSKHGGAMDIQAEPMVLNTSL